MIARGRDASELFPAVVKNVVSKNIEIKKLVIFKTPLFLSTLWYLIAVYTRLFIRGSKLAEIDIFLVEKLNFLGIF